MLKKFEQFNDPYGEENDDVMLEPPEDYSGENRNLEEILSVLDKKGFIEGDDLFDEEYDIIDNNLVDIIYRGVNLSDNCNLFQLGELIVSLDKGDEYGQGYYLAKIDRMEEE
jgi:hypothetical protein